MLQLHCRPVGAFSMNAGLLFCRESGHSVLVDPGAEPETLLEMIGKSQLQAILITHCHGDHIGALNAIRDRCRAPVMAHPGMDPDASPIDADRWLTHGDELTVGRYQLKVFHTPGHTRDQVSFALQNDNRIMVGDTLFEGGPGRTWSAQEFKTTLRTLQEIVMQWPNDTICFPGHGDRFCLGDRKDAIARFVSKDHGDFYGDATWDM